MIYYVRYQVIKETIIDGMLMPQNIIDSMIMTGDSKNEIREKLYNRLHLSYDEAKDKFNMSKDEYENYKINYISIKELKFKNNIYEINNGELLLKKMNEYLSYINDVINSHPSYKTYKIIVSLNNNLYESVVKANSTKNAKKIFIEYLKKQDYYNDDLTFVYLEEIIDSEMITFNYNRI